MCLVASTFFQMASSLIGSMPRVCAYAAILGEVAGNN